MNDRQVGVELFGNPIVHQSLICPLQEGDFLGVVFRILSIMGSRGHRTERAQCEFIRIV